MSTLAIRGRQFPTPILVPSISSFETQLKPSAALGLQMTLREPITLVSAFDFAREEEGFRNACRQYFTTGVLLMDSGGYENARYRAGANYVSKAEPIWTEDEYLSVARQEVYDLIFSFDYFVKKGETEAAYRNRLCDAIKRYNIDNTRIIPVVHLVNENNELAISPSDAPDFCSRVAIATGARFLAIPERELGSGMSERARLAKEIAQSIAKRNCKLHILGCGNLLSFVFLASAGVTLCDGLEWCRTYANDDFHLHHFQQMNEFGTGTKPQNLPGTFLSELRDLPYAIRVAINNLGRIQQFTAALSEARKQNSVKELVEKYFGLSVAAAVQAI